VVLRIRCCGVVRIRVYIRADLLAFGGKFWRQDFGGKFWWELCFGGKCYVYPKQLDSSVKHVMHIHNNSTHPLNMLCISITNPTHPFNMLRISITTRLIR
jgi:hypothetical protein